MRIIWAILVISIFAFFGGAFELKPSNTPFHWWIIGGGITLLVLSLTVFKPGKTDKRYKTGYKDNEDPSLSETNNQAVIVIFIAIILIVIGGIIEYFFY